MSRLVISREDAGLGTWVEPVQVRVGPDFVGQQVEYRVPRFVAE